MAQFRLHEGSQYVVAFGHQKNTIVILGMDGRSADNPILSSLPLTVAVMLMALSMKFFRPLNYKNQFFSCCY